MIRESVYLKVDFPTMKISAYLLKKNWFFNENGQKFVKEMKIKNFVLLSVNKNNAITDVWLTASVKKLPTLALPCGVEKCSTCISPYYPGNYT